MHFPLSPFLRAALVVCALLTSPVPPARGADGTERGGGDPWAQAFVAKGRAVVATLHKWRQRDPSACAGIPLDELRAAVEGDEVRAIRPVRVISYPRVHLVIRGKREEVAAVNDPRRRTIELSQTRWDAKPDEHGRISFALHEYLRFLGIEDAQYEVSGPFLERLREEEALDGYRTQLKARLRAFGAAAQEMFEQSNWIGLQGIEVIRMTTDYGDCVRARSSERREEACLNVAMMIRKSVQSPAGASEAVKARLAANKVLVELRTYLATLGEPALAAYAEERVNEVLDASDAGRAEIKRYAADFKPIVSRECPGANSRFIPCALSYLERVYLPGSGSVLEAAQKRVGEAAEKASAAVDAYPGPGR